MRWGKNFQEMFIEIEARLKSIDEEVVLKRPGFLRYRKPPEFSGFAKKGRNKVPIQGPLKLTILANEELRWGYYVKPSVWKVRWMTNGKWQEKFIYYHPGDVSDNNFVQSVLDSTKNNLKGLFITGLDLPPISILQMYIDQLHPEGLFVAGLEYRNLTGFFPNHEKIPEREQWLKENMTILDHIPPSEDILRLHPKIFYPTLYLLRNDGLHLGE